MRLARHHGPGGNLLQAHPCEQEQSAELTRGLKAPEEYLGDLAGILANLCKP